MSDWGSATTEEIASRLGVGAVALLPCGSTEAHGPHLPLATDVVIARGIARRAADRLRARGVDAIVLPPLAYSVTEFVRAFAGTISVKAATIGALIEEICESALHQGVRVVALVNGHLEPDHARMLKDVAARVSAKGRGAVIFPDYRRPPTVAALGREFGEGGGHGGGYETALVLAEEPSLVKDDVRASLPANRVDIAEKIRAGAGDARAAGGARAYFGDPAAATAAEGERLYAVLAEFVDRAVGDALAAR